MKLTINGREMTVRNDLKAITEKRVAKLEKFFDGEPEITVLFGKKRNLENAEITLVSGGTIFRSEVESDTFNNALDEAIENILRQIRKNKTRLARNLRADVMDFFEEDGESEEPEFYIRRKSFPIKPMSAEEAILQMELLGHMFFVFRDAETDETCVVYKRKDGAYGLIEPQ